MFPASNLPASQMAIVQDSDGKPTLIHNASVPGLDSGTLLVKTFAVALNPSDYKMGLAFTQPGAVMGGDFAGHIVAIDPKAQAMRPNLRVGDAVCGIVHGSNPRDHESGSFAEFVRVLAHLVLRIPSDMSMVDAATLGCTLLTSCIALWDVLNITATPECVAKTPVPVLVYGGSTACGTMAVQLLHLSGLEPIATCSPRNFDLVRSFGATAVYDYTVPDVGHTIKKDTNGRLRHALDCISDQQSTQCCYASLGRPAGHVASLEILQADWKSRDVIKHDFVMCLEGMGKELALEGEYKRPASSEKCKLAARMFPIFQRLLDERILKTHPVEVVGHGLNSIIDGLGVLQSGLVSGKKLVILL
ncbi:hypothetical protein QQS21_008204 [Conoideocrella luteorostrata]|uniref:Enoyl reductase (ER) domain-containing protein n=1 Tax=Conoideocrella luteorostrata TaxID=1105319 RepID=A0AAJ0FRE7_9HYPO|nr:hypothetical protein QQS21_008204 [Conoideocrella luteorostrata]